MKILVTNAGSTSLKFKLFEMPEEKVYCNAYIERVGSDKGIYTYDSETEHIHKENLSIPDYSAGIRMFIDTIRPHFDISEIKAVGFKTVLSKDHYGVHELTEEVLQGMRDFMFVAPAHNTAYLEAIESVKGIIKNVSLIGVFETAFHTTIPKERAMYSIPYEWYEKYGIKKMGYHGASHEYASTTAAQDGPASKIITCHLGGSCSICAVKDGKSVDTSFGLSLQVGIMNSNRIGDIDPYIMPYLLSEGMTMDEVMNGVGKKGGLLGVSGVSGDLREVIEAAENGNERAELAIDMFVNGIVHYIGAYFAEMGGLDQLVFTGGIGERSALIREKVCSGLECMGIKLNGKLNRVCTARGVDVISADDSRVLVKVIKANEELLVARRTFKYVNR